jgi:hypothetical protein
VPDGPLEAALDELYGADPSEFVATRKRLSASLRDAGDRPGANVLQRARRPSTSAWALNQLARREPQLVERLLDTSSALYAAQTQVSNEPEVLRLAIRAHREAVEAATDAAAAVLGERANESFRSEIVSTLRAVSTDEDVGRQLRAGRLTREASSSGFPDAVGLTLVPDLPVSKSANSEREREAKRRADLAAKESARKDAEAADERAERAQARVQQLEGELELARRELDDARVQSRKARRTLNDLR